jgi:hypothetical protein
VHGLCITQRAVPEPLVRRTLACLSARRNKGLTYAVFYHKRTQKKYRHKKAQKMAFSKEG